MQYSCRSRTVCDVEPMDFNTTFDGRKCDHTTRIPLCCKTPLERTLGELPCLCSAQNPNMLVSLSVSRGVQVIAALSDRRAQTAMATETIEKRLEQLMGALLRDYASEEGERSAEHNLKDLRRSKTKRHNVPDSRRALHMHVLERDFGIRARAQLACNMIVQHVQVC